MAQDQIYITYAPEDQNAFDILGAALVNRGQRVLWAESASPNDADVVIALWSPDSIKSKRVLADAEIGAAQSKLLPIIIDPKLKLGGLPPRFRAARTLDIAEQMLAAEVEAILAATKKLEKRCETRTARDRFIKPSGGFGGREEILEDLRRAWQSTSIHVLEFHGAAGSGKSALASHFLEELLAAAIGGPDFVFAWSFDREPNADLREIDEAHFFSAARHLFDLKEDGPVRGRAAAKSLSAALEGQSALVILDGLEAARSAPNLPINLEGVASLIHRISQGGCGTALLTSETPAHELDPVVRKGAARRFEVGALDAKSAIAVLEARGESLTKDQAKAASAALADPSLLQPDWRRLGLPKILGSAARAAKRAVRAENWPLNIALQQSVGRWRQIERGFSGREGKLDLGLAQRIALLGGAISTPQNNEPALLDILLETKLSAGSDAWIRIPKTSRKEAVSASTRRLRALSLLDTPEGDQRTAALTLHPSIQMALLDSIPAKAKAAAHAKLYDYLRFFDLPKAFQAPMPYALLAMRALLGEKEPRALQIVLRSSLETGKTDNDHILLTTWTRASQKEKEEAVKQAGAEQTDAAFQHFAANTEQQKRILYSALRHGCAAGKAEDAAQEVLMARLDSEASIEALRPFFCSTFTTPHISEKSSTAAKVSQQTAEALAKAGRIAESANAAQFAFKKFASHGPQAQAVGSAKIAAAAAIERSDAKTALTFAQHAVDHAEIVAKADAQMSSRSLLAEARFANGELDAAIIGFRSAEAAQAASTPKEPWLSEQQGYALCKQLIIMGATSQASSRSRRAQKSEKPHEQALALVIAAAVYNDTRKATRAIELLENAGDDRPLAEALCLRGRLFAESGRAKEALRDITLAEDIASFRGATPLLIQTALVRARISLKDNNSKAAKADLEEARIAIDAHDYEPSRAELALVNAHAAIASKTEPDLWAVANLAAKGYWAVAIALETMARRSSDRDLKSKIDALRRERNGYLKDQAAYDKRLDEVARGRRKPPNVSDATV